MRKASVFFLLAASLVIGYSALAAGNENYVFSAPPRGTASEETPIYQPVAAYLSSVTGKKIVYQHPGNWLSYQRDMQLGVYDLVFDGPHFVAWRMAMDQHEPVVRLPGKLVFVVVVNEDNIRINEIKDLAGRTVCALAPPNLATLTVTHQFDNPARQPIVVPTKGFKQSYQGLKSGKCSATVLRDKMLKKFNAEGVRTIYTSTGVANQAFSAGPRFAAGDKDKMAAALLAPEGVESIRKFHDRFNKKRMELLNAMPSEYDGLWVFLKDVWGYEVKAAQMTQQ